MMMMTLFELTLTLTSSLLMVMMSPLWPFLWAYSSKVLEWTLLASYPAICKSLECLSTNIYLVTLYIRARLRLQIRVIPKPCHRRIGPKWSSIVFVSVCLILLLVRMGCLSQGYLSNINPFIFDNSLFFRSKKFLLKNGSFYLLYLANYFNIFQKKDTSSEKWVILPFLG